MGREGVWAGRVCEQGGCVGREGVGKQGGCVSMEGVFVVSSFCSNISYKTYNVCALSQLVSFPDPPSARMRVWKQDYV